MLCRWWLGAGKQRCQGKTKGENKRVRNEWHCRLRRRGLRRLEPTGQNQRWWPNPLRGLVTGSDASCGSARRAAGTRPPVVTKRGWFHIASWNSELAVLLKKAGQPVAGAAARRQIIPLRCRNELSTKTNRCGNERADVENDTTPCLVCGMRHIAQGRSRGPG